MLSIDELYELAKDRKSIRGYDKDRDDKEMEKIIMTITRRGSYGKKIWLEDDQAGRKKPGS